MNKEEVLREMKMKRSLVLRKRKLKFLGDTEEIEIEEFHTDEGCVNECQNMEYKRRLPKSKNA